MAKVIRQFIDPVTGRPMSEIDTGAEKILVPTREAGLPMADAIPGFSGISKMQEPAPQEPAAPANPVTTKPASKAPVEVEDTAVAVAKPAAAQSMALQAPPLVTETESVTESRKLSPEMQQERINAMNSMTAANMQMSSAIDAQTKQIQAEAAEKAAFMNAERDAEAARQEEQSRRTQEQFQKFQDVANQYSKEGIDSKRYWANANTADKVLAGIGLLAGAWAYGRGVTDRNYGADYIQNAIDRDIKEQEMNLQKKKFDVDTQRTLYTDLRQQGLDQDAAAAKTREMAYNALEAKLAGMAASSKSEASKAALAQQMAEFKQKAANEAMQFSSTVSRTSSRTVPMVAAKRNEVSEQLLKEKADAETGIEGLHKLEDKMQEVTASGKAGGMTNYIMAVAKDQLGLQKDPDVQEVWKGWEQLLMKERAKVFGASLTASEKESFQNAVTTFKSQPELLMKAMRDIRAETERLYANRMRNFKDLSGLPQSYVTLRIDTEKDVNSGKVKQAPSFK